MYQLQYSLSRDKYKHKEEDKHNYQFLQTRSFVGWGSQMYTKTIAHTCKDKAKDNRSQAQLTSLAEKIMHRQGKAYGRVDSL